MFSIAGPKPWRNGGYVEEEYDSLISYILYNWFNAKIVWIYINVSREKHLYQVPCIIIPRIKLNNMNYGMVHPVESFTWEMRKQ